MNWDKSRRDIEAYNVGLAEDWIIYKETVTLGHDDDDQFNRPD